MKKVFIFALALVSVIRVSAQSTTYSWFDWDTAPAAPPNERLATSGPNGTNSGSVAEAQTPGSGGVGNGCAPGVIAFGSSGCFTAGGCAQNINLEVPTGALFNQPSMDFSMDYRHMTVGEIDAWFFSRGAFRFGLRFEKINAQFEYDNGGSSVLADFTAFPSGATGPTAGKTWDGVASGTCLGWGTGGSAGVVPRDNTKWVNYRFSYNHNTGIAAIVISDPTGPYVWTQVISTCIGCPMVWTGSPANMYIGQNADNNKNDASILDNGWVGSLMILPVTLSSFKTEPEGNTVKVSWETTDETSNRLFTVLKSVDQENWTQIGEIQGHGTTSADHKYEFIDKYPNAGVSYYLINQYDYNGNGTGYGPMTVNMEFTTNSILSVFPNPVQKGLDLSITVEAADVQEPMVFRVVDIAGKVVHEETQFAQGGIQEIHVNTSDIPAGIYMLEMKMDGRTSVKKFQVVE